jgi:NADH-quinone oxidoreductase subunit L
VSGTVLLPSVVALPAVTGLVLLLLGRLAPRVAGLAGAAATVVLAGSAALATVAGLRGSSAAVPFLLGADVSVAATGVGGLLLPLVLGVAALVQLAALGAARTREPRFVGLMLLFSAAAALTVAATNLPTLLLGWELMGAASYALIGYDRREERAVASGTTAFLTTRAADLGLYVAVAAVFAGSGGAGLDLAALADVAPGWRDAVAAGILVAALGKAAQLPFSFWLSRAMDGPSPVSALLHSAAMVALGGYLLVVAAPLLAATGWADHAAAWLGVATAVALGAVAVVQTDLKQLLAASTASQLGFVVLAAGVGATSAGAAHLVGHAAVKALLFLAAGAWLEALGSKDLGRIAGAARRWPAVGAAAVAALLSLAGLPPLTLWATKDAVLAEALEASPALYAAGLVAAGLSAAYAAVALVALLRPPDGSDEGPRHLPLVVPVALAPLAVGAVGLGLLTLPAVMARLPGRAAVTPHVWELALSAGVALLGVAVVVRGGMPVPARVRDWLRGWMGLEGAAHRWVVSPVLALAEAAARVDDRVLARTVDAAARSTTGAAARAHEGDRALSNLVDQTAAAVRRAGLAVRRSSRSGQLHHYYLQLVVGVLVVVVAWSVVGLLGSQG